ncbi:transcription initiation factor tfiid subunit 8 [Nicotiana attenuata]|uniref:Transcription initiation factor tfiid subunit 8 n=1 Tax=Nicotiana attenuata TaxID=49451 RepID=A0A1J6IH49_NICAT|nr:transcription initiation factor tfiid subunit 8 [Nicotiana attenuata]
MTDGGNVEGKREKESNVDNTGEERAGFDDFGRAISRIAVAQICESIGFESFNESALESLADVAIKYIIDLGKTASSGANLAGRTQCNVFDVIQGLEDMCAFHWFSARIRCSQLYMKPKATSVVYFMHKFVGLA